MISILDNISNRDRHCQEKIASVPDIELFFMLMDPTIRNFQNTIIHAAEQKLGRKLTEKEKKFIVSRGGFIALEMILDTVKAETKEHVEKYLNSE